MANFFRRMSNIMKKDKKDKDEVTSTARQDDGPFSFLSTFDTKFLIDDSSSMDTKDTPGSPTRWNLVSSALAEIAPICTLHDKDGIDIHFLNQPDDDSYMNIRTPKTVHKIFNQFKPDGGTPTGERLGQILYPYVEACKTASDKKKEAPKPLMVIVITDGIATDKVKPVLGRIGKKLDEMDAISWQVGVQFFQVGDDEEATEELAFLDDELAELYGCRDFMDTQRFDPGKGKFGGDLILKTLLGALDKKWDRKKIEGRT